VIPGEPPTPRVLIAGPHFGVPPRTSEEIARIYSDSHKPWAQRIWEVRHQLASEEVKQAQISAIARYDVILDASPWHAFARWHSLGFHDAERQKPKDDAPVGFSVFPDPEKGEALSLERMEALKGRWPWFFERISELASQGLAVAGFSGSAPLEWCQRITSLWPAAPVLADGNAAEALHERKVHAATGLDAPLSEPTLRDYLRALKVVAGQVRLLGENHERPIEDVFVEMEVARREKRRVRRAGSQSMRRAESDPERPDASEFDDELTTHEDELRRRQVMLRTGQLLSVGSRILLWGPAGMGKSTLLRWLACGMAGSAFVPVWVGRLPVPENDLADQLSRMALESVGLPNGPSPARRQLAEDISSGRAHLFLDALDEAPTAVRLSLISRIAGLGPGVKALIASRPIHEPPRGSGFLHMDLRGLAAGGPRTFLQGYYGHALEAQTLLSELRSLADGERWIKTPVLLSLAANLHQRNRRLPDATLALYREVVQALLEQTATRHGMLGEDARLLVVEERQRVIQLARGMLLPDSGDAKLALPRSDVSDFLMASGFFTGDRWLLFAHLTLGEYLAASAPLDLERERAQWKTREPGTRPLEVLPMAHALRGETELERALQEAREHDESDHRMLSLVLRAVAYGGEGVATFCSARAAGMVALVAERMQLASGRFGDDEQALMLEAERAFRVMRPWLHAGSDEHPGDEAPLLPLLERTGFIGAEAQILVWATGLRSPSIERLWITKRRRQVIGPLLRSGVTPWQIIEHSRGEEDTVRAAAIRSLREDPEARPLLRKLLDDHLEIRAEAIRALAGDEEAKPAIRDAAWDQYWVLREAAAQALEGDEDARQVLPELIAQWMNRKQRRSEKPRTVVRKFVKDVKDAAAGVLAGKAKSKPALKALLSQAIMDASLLQGLERNKEARLAFRKMLNHADATTRSVAARVVTGDLKVRPQLRELLKDSDENVRAAAADALVEDEQSRPILREMLKPDDWFLRMELAEHLAGDSESAEVLTVLFRDKNWLVSNTARRALAMDVALRPRLRELLLWSDFPNARRTWAETLADDEEVKPSLRVLLKDEDASVRAAAAGGLTDDIEAKPELRTLLGDPDAGVRAAAARALVGDVEARPALRKLLQDASESVRAAAARALEGDVEARPLLYQLLKDPEMDNMGTIVGVEAAKALAMDEASRPDLRKFLRDTNADVRRAAVEALAKDVESWPELRPLLKDQDERVREAAAFALAENLESRSSLRELLKDEAETVRRAAARALEGDSESSPCFRELLSEERELRQMAVQALRTSVRPLAGDPLVLHTVPGKSSPLIALKALQEIYASEHQFLDEKLEAFLRAPQPIRLERYPDFAEAILGWLCARLAYASKDGKLSNGRLHGEFPSGMPDRHFQPGGRILIRISMDADDLPQERLLYPLHNLIEAWRVARHLRVEDPPAIFLACADVAFSDLHAVLPELKPGQLVTGPTFFGFRLPRGQAPTGDPTLLLSASTLATERWEQASEEERACHIHVLASLVEDPDLDPWVLVPLLARIGHLLPPGLRAALANRLPPSADAAGQLLHQATKGLRKQE
jgi:HEAT repeat protein